MPVDILVKNEVVGGFWVMSLAAVVAIVEGMKWIIAVVVVIMMSPSDSVLGRRRADLSKNKRPPSLNVVDSHFTGFVGTL